MATHQSSSASSPQRLSLREHAWPLFQGCLILGCLGLLAAVFLGYRGYANENNFSAFFYVYLANYLFFLTITLGALFFVILQHLTKAAWSVNVRRIAEWLASSMPLMAALSAPIVLSVLLRRGDLYSWAAKDGTLGLNHFKQIYLSPAFFLARVVFCYAVWSWLGVWYWKQSIKQDETGDIQLTVRMQALAAPAMVLFAFTLTSMAFDLIMSLDARYGSTMFGVYIFAGSAVSFFATLILIVLLLQSRGFLRESVTIEHFHDMGKFLFGFTFFFGYIGYSQYMLQWYASLPEETHWLKIRGATTAGGLPGNGYMWSYVIIAILFGHVLIPFAGLLSRHVKRNPMVLGFWAIWLLCFHWLDLYWMTIPQLDGQFHLFVAKNLATFFGLGGLIVAFVIRQASHASIRPVHDPRLADSLAFENV
ncbi:MAG: hypothetical protein M3O30_04150 [Planctomycetota bacterium]|nr:hypothetical protein [Planctomycetota bacterium]